MGKVADWYCVWIANLKYRVRIPLYPTLHLKVILILCPISLKGKA